MVREQHFRNNRYKMRIFEKIKYFDTSGFDCGKTVAVMKETRPKVNSRVRNLQENVWLSFENIKNLPKFEEEEGGTIGKFSLLKILSKNCEKIQ